MVDTIWIAFGCGLLIGSMFGILCLGLVSINRDNKHRDELDIANGRVADLELQRKLLKGEIFRLTKNYKPRKPQPRRRRNYKKNNSKK